VEGQKGLSGHCGGLDFPRRVQGNEYHQVRPYSQGLLHASLPRLHFWQKTIHVFLFYSRNGEVSNIEKKTVNVFKIWCENIYKNRPQGSLVIQSTTAHNWPYPFLLYKRGVV